MIVLKALAFLVFLALLLVVSAVAAFAGVALATGSDIGFAGAGIGLLAVVPAALCVALSAAIAYLGWRGAPLETRHRMFALFSIGLSFGLSGLAAALFF